MPHILLFDSGLGGLTVWQQIHSLLPDVTCHYLFDNAAFPYGELADDVLLERVCQLIVPLVKQYPVSLVVIACNTASTLALEPLRALLDIPVVGVVPAIKPAAKQTQKHHIGLLATPATISRPYTDRLISEFAADCKVTRVGVSELVRMAEDKLLGRPVALTALAKLVRPLLAGPDVIVLGCTHFPLLSAELKSVLGEHVSLLDSGAAIAARVAWLLAHEACPLAINVPSGNYYIATAAVAEPRRLETAMAVYDLLPVANEKNESAQSGVYSRQGE